MFNIIKPNFLNQMIKSKKHIATFVLKLILFSSVLACIIIVCIVPYAPDLGQDNRYINSLKKISNKEYDILLFGNSYVFTAYDPLIIKEKLNLNALHLNVGAQRLEASLIIANEVIKNRNVKYILFDVSGTTLRKPKVDDTEAWQYQTKGLQEIPISLEKIINLSKFYPDNTQTEYYMTSISKKLGRLLRLNDRKHFSKKSVQNNSETLEKTVYFSTNGFIANRQKHIEKEKFLKSFYVKPNLNGFNDLDSRWDTSLCSLMDDFLQKTSSRGINVVLINSLKLYATNYESEVINEFTEKYSTVKFLDLNMNKDLYALDERAFYNNTHLNYRGSIQVTERLTDSIAKWFDVEKENTITHSFQGFNLINTSYALNENEDKFIKLEFDSIPESLKDHQLVITIHTKDTLKLSDYFRKNNFKSDSFYVKMNSNEIISLPNSKVVVKRLKTKISKVDVEKIKIFFYKANDTLNLPSFKFSPK